MASPVTIPTVTFSENPIGTTNPVYTFSGLLPDGKVFHETFTGVIVKDISNPTTPSFAANASYLGPVIVEFDTPVSSLDFDAGVFDTAGSTQITVMGPHDFVVKKVLNPVSAPTTYSHFHFDFGENAITQLVLEPVAGDTNGFALDNLSVSTKPETKSIALSGDLAIDNLLFGTIWRDDVVSFSFLETNSKMPGYGTGPETFTGSKMRVDTMGVFNPDQRALTKAALNEWSGVSGLKFSQVNETPDGAPGIMRFGTAGIDAPADGFLPSNSPQAGDVRIKTGALNHGAQPGSYDYMVFLHEVGHALGLKHPHEARGIGKIMPPDKDSVEFSVMSYRDYPASNPDDVFKIPAGSYPQSLMMNDIAAIQYMYGANFTRKSGDTTYTFNPGKAKYFETIWDGGGKDTYDASGYDVKTSLDLRPGKWSVLDEDQLAELKPSAPKIHARGSIFNALQYNDDPRSLIENAIGGSKHDKILGNQIGNELEGRKGDDRIEGLGHKDELYGGKGDDKVFGGSGDDKVVGGLGHDDLHGGVGKDTFVFSDPEQSPAGPDHDVIHDFVEGDDRLDLRLLDTHKMTFIGKADFTHAHQLNYHFSGGDTIVAANLDKDDKPEFQVELHGKVDPAGDLMLG